MDIYKVTKNGLLFNQPVIVKMANAAAAADFSFYKTSLEGLKLHFSTIFIGNLWAATATHQITMLPQLNSSTG